jgi:hypothetical protein
VATREQQRRGLVLFSVAAISVVCAASQGCSQRLNDDQETAQESAEIVHAVEANQEKRQGAELAIQQQAAEAIPKPVPISAPDHSALDATTCQKITLYWGSIAQARDNGVSLDEVLHTINDRAEIPGEFDPYIEAMARDGRAEESKDARYIYKHREISPVKFQDRAYRECIDSDRRYWLKQRKEEEDQLRLPGL